MKKTKEKVLDALEDKKDIEDYMEELAEYSDRQIVVEVLNIITTKQIKKLVEELKQNY